MTHLDRKLATLCTYRGCTSPPLEDHCQCQRHRDAHRERNRRWWRKLSSPTIHLSGSPVL